MHYTELPKGRRRYTSLRIGPKLSVRQHGSRRGVLKNNIMKNLSKILNSRRIKGLFASIVENGSMVSLAGNWTRVDGCNELSVANKLVAEGTAKGFEMKIKESDRGSKYSIYKRTTGSVADLIKGFGWRVISVAFPNRVKFAGRLRLLHRVSLLI